MNKLEQQFKDAFDEQYQKFRHTPTYKELAQVAAKIALELAEKAFKEGNMRHNDLLDDELKVCFDQFKQEIL